MPTDNQNTDYVPFTSPIPTLELIPYNDQPQIPSHLADPCQKQWSGYFEFNPGTPSADMTIEVGADDNAYLTLSHFPNSPVNVLPNPNDPNGGGTYRRNWHTFTNTPAGFYFVTITYVNVGGVAENLSQLTVTVNDTPMVIGRLTEPTSLDWPTTDIMLGHPIHWYEVRNDDSGTPSVTDQGVIDRVTPSEFKQLAAIMFGEQSTFNQDEHLAIASVMHNRWGRGKHDTLDNRGVIKTVADDINHNTWRSIGGSQYTKAMNETVEGVELISLSRIIETLKYVLSNGPVNDFDFMVANGTNPNRVYVRIGGHDFARVLRDCGKPDWYTED